MIKPGSFIKCKKNLSWTFFSPKGGVTTKTFRKGDLLIVTAEQYVHMWSTGVTVIVLYEGTAIPIFIFVGEDEIDYDFQIL